MFSGSTGAADNPGAARSVSVSRHISPSRPRWTEQLEPDLDRKRGVGLVFAQVWPPDGAGRGR